MQRKRPFRLLLWMLVATMMIGLLPMIPFTGLHALAVDTSSYPVQAVQIGAYNTKRGLSHTGTSVNTGDPGGIWRIDYVSDGVYQIVSLSDGTYLTANSSVCTMAAKNDSASQNWNIVGVTQDHEGYGLYYQIVNTSTNTALTYYQGNNTVGLTAYTGDGAQKWKLNLYGQEGFSGNCMVAEGEKAANIGGLLGRTVTASTADELEAYLNATEPLTIVVTGNIDMQNKFHTRIRDYKTIVGSYSANTIADCYLRTNDEYGAENDSPSDNIVIRNIDFQAVNVEDRILINIWSSRNIWIDHCTFNSQLTRDRDEVGKFIWINTPYESYLDAKDRLRSPDYVTISYCTFANRYWTVAYGTQNDETSRCRTTLCYNLWDDNVRRCPQIGNGNGHIYNNYYVGNDNGNDSGTAQIIGGDGSNIVSENCRFVSYDNVYPYSICAGRGNDPYRDSGSYYAQKSDDTPTPLTVDIKVTSTWVPSQENYGYSLIDAYNTSGTDIKAFCESYAGAVSSASALKYITDVDMTKYVATCYASPYLTDGFNSAYGELVTEFTPAVLKEGAVYMIQNVGSGLYLEVEGAAADNGTRVQQWGATEPASHNTWRVLSAGDGYYYLYPQIADKVSYLLDVTDNSPANGVAMNIWSETGADAQKFKFYQNADGSYHILTKSSGDQSCVAIESASNSSGASAVQWKVDLSDTSQQWTLTQVEDTGCTMDTTKTYMFRNANSDLYMEVENGTAEDNANVQQWGANGSALHNSWTLESFGGGYYYIVSRLADGSTYYLNAAGSENGANIEILTNNRTSSHLFKFVKNPDGTYYILTRASRDAAAVEVANASTSSGANVQQWEVNGHSCQKWVVETVNVPEVTTTQAQTPGTTAIAAETTETTVVTTVPTVSVTTTGLSLTDVITTELEPEQSTTIEDISATLVTTASTLPDDATTTAVFITTTQTVQVTVVTTGETGATGSDAVTTSQSATEATMSTTGTTTVPVGYPGNVFCGDVNLDGVITMSDVILLSKYALRLVDLNDISVRSGDCNADGMTDGIDALILLRFSVQLIQSLPDTSGQ